MKPEELKVIVKRELAGYDLKNEGLLASLIYRDLQKAAETFERHGFVVVPKEPTPEMISSFYVTVGEMEASGGS